jgi:hypothetical protein
MHLNMKSNRGLVCLLSPQHHRAFHQSRPAPHWPMAGSVVSLHYIVYMNRTYPFAHAAHLPTNMYSIKDKYIQYVKIQYSVCKDTL